MYLLIFLNVGSIEESFYWLIAQINFQVTLSNIIFLRSFWIFLDSLSKWDSSNQWWFVAINNIINKQLFIYNITIIK